MDQEEITKNGTAPWKEEKEETEELQKNKKEKK